MLKFVQEKVSKGKVKNSFKDVLILLENISLYLSQLSRGLAFLNFHEGYLEEGTIKDRAYVEDKIKKLQPLIEQLDKAKFIFDSKEKVSQAEIQSELNLSSVNLKALHEDMLCIWSMRNKGKSEKDNERIQDLMKTLFANVCAMLKQIQGYVEEYNQVNETKLVFKVKWSKLPK